VVAGIHPAGDDAVVADEDQCVARLDRAAAADPQQLQERPGGAEDHFTTTHLFTSVKSGSSARPVDGSREEVLRTASDEHEGRNVQLPCTGEGVGHHGGGFAHHVSEAQQEHGLSLSDQVADVLARDAIRNELLEGLDPDVQRCVWWHVSEQCAARSVVGDSGWNSWGRWL